MLLNCLVKENPDIRVLHWCPGPMKTDMVEGLHTKSIDPSIRTAMTGLCTVLKFLEVISVPFHPL